MISKQANSAKIYLLLFSLYWAQGLPVGFMTHALPVILRTQGVSLAHIGGFGLLLAPWAIKILWAPYVDRIGRKSMGHYRSWILPTQCMTVVLLIILSFLPIETLNQPIYLMVFFILMLSINSLGATQDIATDALAVNILKGEQQHIGNMFQVVGSRLGFIVGGGAILWVLDWLNWQITFLSLALIVLLNTIPVWFYQEPEHAKHLSLKQKQLEKDHENKTENKKSIVQLTQNYLRYFTKTRNLFLWLIVLLTIKIADGLSGPLLKPLMVDMGLSLTQIGVYVTMLGAIAALAGAGLASWSLNYLGRSQALVLFSIFKLMSLAAYVYLAHQYQQQAAVSPWVIYLIHACEDLFSAMLLVVILTLVMQYSRKDFAGTDFTFQVSIMALVSGGLYTISGILGDVLGYETYLKMILVLGILLLWPIFKWKKSICEDEVKM